MDSCRTREVSYGSEEGAGNLRYGNFWKIRFLCKVCEPHSLSSAGTNEPLPWDIEGEALRWHQERPTTPPRWLEGRRSQDPVPQVFRASNTGQTFVMEEGRGTDRETLLSGARQATTLLLQCVAHPGANHSFSIVVVGSLERMGKVRFIVIHCEDSGK